MSKVENNVSSSKDIANSIEEMKKHKKKFDESVDMIILINDTKKKKKKKSSEEENVRGSIELPHPLIPKKKLIVFANEEDKKVLSENKIEVTDVEQVKDNPSLIEKSIVIVRENNLKNISKIMKPLGCKGCAPSKKNGTIHSGDMKAFVKKCQLYSSGGIVHYSGKKSIQVRVGNLSMDSENIVKNTKHAIDYIENTHGKKVSGIKLTSTMYKDSFTFDRALKLIE